jgi:hypothetical protein
MMEHLLKITDFYREEYPDIKRFQLVFYNDRKHGHPQIKHYFWVNAAELHEFKWLKPEVEKVMERFGESDLQYRDFNLGLSNCIEMVDGSKKFPPFLDFDIGSWRIQPTRNFTQEDIDRMQSVALERVRVSLALLQVGRGIIVDSGNAYHFFGLDLWTKEQWIKFVSDGTWDQYQEVLGDRKMALYPKWDGYAANNIGSSWGRMVTRQKNSFFLRVSPKRSTVPEIRDIYDDETLSSGDPPDDAPCQIAHGIFREEYYKIEKLAWEKAAEGDHSLFPKIMQHTSLTDFCQLPCSYEGTTWYCPAIQRRLGYKSEGDELE